LVWGVEDATQIIKGTNCTFSTAKQSNQDLELWLRNLIHPSINFEIFEFESNGKHIVLMRIPAAKGEPVNFQKNHLLELVAIKQTLEIFQTM